MRAGRVSIKEATQIIASPLSIWTRKPEGSVVLLRGEGRMRC
jgi:hypothetical protein